MTFLSAYCSGSFTLILVFFEPINAPIIYLSLLTMPSDAPLTAYDKLEAVMREESKYSEQLVALLKDPSQNLIEKASLLSALHPATEPQPRTAATAKARNPKRVIGETDSAVGSPAPLSDVNVEKVKKSKTHMQRSASVTSQAPRDGQAARLEDAVDGARGSAAEKAGTLKVGAAVMYRPNKASHNFDGEGIQCTIKSLQGDGIKKRYNSAFCIIYLHALPLTCSNSVSPG